MASNPGILALALFSYALLPVGFGSLALNYMTVAYTPTPDKSALFTALGNFLVEVLPANTSIVQGQANRVPEPANVNFVVMTPTRQVRLETNVDTYQDCLFTATVAGNVMTVSSVQVGTIQVGATLAGVGLSSGTTTIIGMLTGTGGPGTYQLSGPLSYSGQLAAGAQTFMQPSEYTIQLDVHGPLSQDNSVTITTLFRDDFAVQFFANQNSGIAPLFADDPRQVPFINAENAYEDRWIVEAHIQVNAAVAASQQFADSLTLDLVEVQ